MENKQIRFRDSWFVQAGVGIVVLSALPFVAVVVAGLLFHKDIEIGPTFLCFVLGAGFGCLAVTLGIAGVIVQRLPRKPPPQ